MWMPQEGGWINAQLPGELMRARVVTVCSENVVICQLAAAPVSKIHGYSMEQPIPLRRVNEGFGEVWKAVSESEMALAVQEDEKAAEARRLEEERLAAEETAKKAMGQHAFTVTRS